MKPVRPPDRPGFRIGRDPATGGYVYVPIRRAEPPGPSTDVVRVRSGSDDRAALRGVALVDAALEARARTSRRELAGMEPAALAAIDLAGRPMSPGMARWLATDRWFRPGPPRGVAGCSRRRWGRGPRRSRRSPSA